MEKAKISLHYNRKNYTDSNGNSPIFIEVYKGGKNPIRKRIHTSISVRKNQWDDEKKMVVKHHQDIQHNRMLAERIRAIEDFEFNLFNNKKELTAQNLEVFLAGNDMGSYSFTAFCEAELTDFTTLKLSTHVSHNAVLKTLKEYKSDISFQDLDYNLIHDFDRYLRKKGLAQNTIAKYHKIIKTYINLAIKRKKFTEDSPYLEFKSKWVDSDRVNLTYDELKKIEDVEISEAFPEQMVVKDAFLLSCYCGLRYDDVFTLKKSEVFESKGELTIVKRMEKVNKMVTLPLHTLFDGKGEQIVKRNLLPDKDYIFKPMSNQYVNRELKSLASTAKLKTRLTFHIARHTFGTMLAEATQNPYLIMDLMGHADIKTSMIYIHSSKERIDKQLRAVNWNVLNSAPKIEPDQKEV